MIAYRAVDADAVPFAFAPVRRVVPSPKLAALERFERHLLEWDSSHGDARWRAFCSELLQQLHPSVQTIHYSTTLATCLTNAVEQHSLASTKTFWGFFTRLNRVIDTSVTCKLSDTNISCTYYTWINANLKSALWGPDPVRQLGPGHELLSSRDLKSVWWAVIKELETSELPPFLWGILVRIRDLLVEGLRARIESRRSRGVQGRLGSLTRDQALSFAILIDLPPPHRVIAGPVVHRLGLMHDTRTMGEEHASLQRDTCRGSISDGLHFRATKAHRAQGPLDHPPATRCAHLAGCPGNRPHRAMVQLPAPIRALVGRQMVGHLRLGRLNRRGGAQGRAEVERRCA